jgi:divalent metal cation (Fe/Co/Zn/Cd) transporter
VRTDPTENGGLFIGRRPGTAPVRYRAVPERKGVRRRIVDDFFGTSILALMTLVAVMFWGPIPAAWLWVGSRFYYWTDNVGLAILIAFVGMLFTLLAGLAAMRRLDQFWILVRRAAGYDQRKGVIGPVFAIAAVIGVTLFTIWLLFFAGLGPTFAPRS